MRVKLAYKVDDKISLKTEIVSLKAKAPSTLGVRNLKTKLYFYG